MRTNRPLAWLAFGAVLAVDWAALDDITTGHEPSLWMEWTTVLASAPVLLLLARLGTRRNVHGGPP